MCHEIIAKIKSFHLGFQNFMIDNHHLHYFTAETVYQNFIRIIVKNIPLLFYFGSYRSMGSCSSIDENKVSSPSK